MSRTLSCACLLFAVSACSQIRADKEDKPKAVPKSLQGIWLGALKVGPQEVPIAFQLKSEGDQLTGTFDILEQRGKGKPLSHVERKENTVRLECKAMGVSFKGKLNDAETEIVGEFSQRKATLPLTLRRADKLPTFARPQEPKPPYPYEVEDVVFENHAAEVKLAGTLTRPRSAQPVPAVVLITGSEPQDRDETVAGHKPFLVLADHLTRQGIAVLRYDDRGTAKSTGNFLSATTADFADDALAGVAYLKRRKEINAKKIGLAGHSEGGVAAPIAAVKSPDVAFIVLLAGTGVSGEEISLKQIVELARGQGANEKYVDWNLGLQRRLLVILREEKDDARARKAIRAVMDEEVGKLPEKERSEFEKVRPFLEQQLAPTTFKWTRFFLTHNPRETLDQSEMPGTGHQRRQRHAGGRQGQPAGHRPGARKGRQQGCDHQGISRPQPPLPDL
jgi:uncharacterized protein